MEEELGALDDDDKRELITGLTRQLVGVGDEAHLDPEQKERKRERIRRVIQRVNQSLKGEDQEAHGLPHLDLDSIAWAATGERLPLADSVAALPASNGRIRRG